LEPTVPAANRSRGYFAPGPPGRTGQAAKKWLAARPEADRLLGALLVDMAATMDGCRRMQDPKLLLQASKEVQRLMALLEPPESGRDVGDQDADAGGGGAASADPLAGIVGSGPEVRDAEDAE